MPKEKSEAINRRTNNTMVAKRKRGKRTNNDVQDTTHKTKDRVTQTPLNIMQHRPH